MVPPFEWDLCSKDANYGPKIFVTLKIKELRDKYNLIYRYVRLDYVQG
jgi:hypothetical protein